MRTKLKLIIMAVIYTAIIGGFSYGFDFEDQRIDIDALLTTVDANNLWDSIQEAQASSEGIPFDQVAIAEGLTPLSTGISTFLTVALLDNWEIKTLKTSGKFEIAGGNVVRADGSDPFRDNPLITYINNLSQAGVVADGGGGGSVDLTPVLNAIAALDTKTNQINAKTTRINEKNP